MPVINAGCVARVLVMDNEPIILDVAGELLKELGHDATFAEHGEDAVDKYLKAWHSERPFEMVILDLTVRGGMGCAEILN